jgi:hypothetical protein
MHFLRKRETNIITDIIGGKARLSGFSFARTPLRPRAPTL